MSNMQPIIIKRDRFICTIYDIPNFMKLPLANVRKLWKIMFSAEDENRETIQTIRDWLSVLVSESANCIPQAEKELAAAKATAAQRHSENAAMGENYWQKRVTDLKALSKRAAFKGNTELLHALENAIARRDAPKLADQSVRAAQKNVVAAKAYYEKALRLESVFNELNEK